MLARQRKLLKNIELKKQGGRLDQNLAKAFRGQQLNELQVRKILHAAGFKTYPRPKGIPSDCHVTISKRSGGMLYIKKGTTSDQSIHIRVMPGNPKSKYMSQRKPYVVQRRGSQAISKEGKLVEYEGELAHIPLSEFKFHEW